MKFLRAVVGFFVGATLVLPGLGFAQQKDKLSYRFTSFWNGWYAPYFIALDEGYYDQEGISLTLLEGKGSNINLQLLASGSEMLANSDYGTVAQAVAKGVPVKAIFGEMQQSPMAIIFLADAKIKSPKDLEGKSVATTPGDSNTQIFPALLAANGADIKKIRIINADVRAKDIALLERQADAILSYFFHRVPLYEEKGAKVAYLKYSDFGVNMLANGVVANNKAVAEKPGLLRRFFKATSKGWEFTLNQPEEAINALMKRNPRGTKEVQLKILLNGLPLLHTKNTQGKPIGWMAKEDWEETQELLFKYGGLGTKVKIDTYYTNEFITR